jgi:hypothetical protein
MYQDLQIDHEERGFIPAAIVEEWCCEVSFPELAPRRKEFV